MLPESALYYRNFDGTLHPLNSIDGMLPVLTRVKLDRWSCYMPRGAEPSNQNILHSVSNILKLTQDERTKKFLLKWEADFGRIESNRVRDEAIRAGNTIHAYLHSYLTDGEIKPVEETYKSYLNALNQLLPNFKDSLLSEQLFVSFKYQYFGKIDQLGLYRGSLTLSDLKTALKPKLSLSWVQDKLLQLAAYYIPIEALYPIEQAALIYLISDGSYNEFLFTPKQMELYKELWIERVSQVHERMSSAA